MAKNEVKVNLKVDDNGNLKKTGNKACVINRIVTNKKVYTT